MGINPQAEAKYINSLLHSFKVGAVVDMAIATPAYFYYGLRLRDGQRLNKLQNAIEDIESRVHQGRLKSGNVGKDEYGAPLPTTVRFSSVPLAMEINRPDALPLAWSTRQWSPRTYTALAGRYYESTGGYPIVIDIAGKNQAHMLVSGATDSGKSNLVDGLVCSFAESTPPSALEFVFIDLDNRHFDVFAPLPHTFGIAYDSKSAVEALKYASAKMGKVGSKRTLIVVDELMMLVEENETATSLIQDIAERGRKHGVHLLLATQKPLSSDIGSRTKSNLTVRICGSVLSTQDSNTALNLAGCGAEKLPGRGAFILRNGQMVRRFQAYHFTNEESHIAALCSRYGSEGAMHHFAPPAPVQVENIVNHVLPERNELAPPAAPVQSGALHQSAPPLAPLAGASFPLPEKRSLSDKEASIVREMYTDGASKNQLQIAVYGSRSTRYKGWIDEALEENEILSPQTIRLSDWRASA